MGFRCQDRERGKEQKSSFLVETTAWEGDTVRQANE